MEQQLWIWAYLRSQASAIDLSPFQQRTVPRGTSEFEMESLRKMRREKESEKIEMARLFGVFGTPFKKKKKIIFLNINIRISRYLFTYIYFHTYFQIIRYIFLSVFTEQSIYI